MPACQVVYARVDIKDSKQQSCLDRPQHIHHIKYNMMQQFSIWHHSFENDAVSIRLQQQKMTAYSNVIKLYDHSPFFTYEYHTATNTFTVDIILRAATKCHCVGP